MAKLGNRGDYEIPEEKEKETEKEQMQLIVDGIYALKGEGKGLTRKGERQRWMEMGQKAQVSTARALRR